MSRQSELIDLEVTLLHETPDAILVDNGSDGDGIWIPKSIVEYEVNGRRCEITLPRSYAEKKGLV